MNIYKLKILKVNCDDYGDDYYRYYYLLYRWTRCISKGYTHKKPKLKQVLKEVLQNMETR